MNPSAPLVAPRSGGGGGGGVQDLDRLPTSASAARAEPLRFASHRDRPARSLPCLSCFRSSVLSVSAPAFNSVNPPTSAMPVPIALRPHSWQSTYHAKRP